MSTSFDLSSCSCCGVVSACCPGVRIPKTLHLSFSGYTGTCSCLNSVTAVLTWNSSVGNWNGPYTANCGGTGTAFLVCQSGVFNLSLSGQVIASGQGLTGYLACSPTFSTSGSFAASCSGGTPVTGTATLTA